MYGKIFPQLYTGSMVGSGFAAFALWGYIISNARVDENSSIELNPVLLAAVFGESKARIKKAIEFFCKPDLRSRSPVEGGRRLVKEGEFLYRVVNLEAWRNRTDHRTEYWRKYRREKRSEAKAKQTPKNVNRCEQIVNRCEQAEQFTHADADADADAFYSEHSTVIADQYGGRKIRDKKKSPNGREPDWHSLSLNEKAIHILGIEEWNRDLRWEKRASGDPARLSEVIDKLHADLAEGAIVKNRGAYAEELWKIAK